MNTELDHAQFIDMGPVSRDFRFNMKTYTDTKGAKSLFVWLAQAFIKRWPIENEFRMPDLLGADEEILKPKGNCNA